MLKHDDRGHNRPGFPGRKVKTKGNDPDTTGMNQEEIPEMDDTMEPNPGNGGNGS